MRSKKRFITKLNDTANTVQRSFKLLNNKHIHLLHTVTKGMNTKNK